MDAVALNKIRARELRIMNNTEGSKEMSVGRMKKRARHETFTGMPSRATHRWPRLPLNETQTGSAELRTVEPEILPKMFVWWGEQIQVRHPI